MEKVRRNFKAVKICGLIMFIVLFMTMMPTYPTFAITNDDVSSKINSLKSLFPQGSYFTANGKACTGSYIKQVNGVYVCYSTSCPNCKLKNVLSSNSKASNTNVANCTNHGNTNSCCAFANFAFSYIFGHDSEQNIQKIRSSDYGGINDSFLSKLKKGDFLNFDNGRHFAIFLGYDSSYIYLYESNYSSPCKVEYNHKRLLSKLNWSSVVANRSLTYEGEEAPAVDIISLPDKNTITDTNAILWAQVNKPSSAAVTKIGCRLRKDGDTFDNGWSKYETPSRNYVGSTYMQPYYNMNTELGAKLTHATKYYVQFYAEVGGKKYWSVEYYFHTTGQHSYGQWNTTTPATCTTTGVKKRSCACGKYETQNIPMLGHNMGAWRTSIEATCSVAGTQIQECSRCTYYNTKAIPVKAHSYSSSWIISSTHHWNECTACGAKKDHAAHVPGVAATETKPQICTVCGYIITPALDHQHQYSESWQYDSSGHWYACSGCSERKSFTKHLYDSECDSSCNVCGYVRAVSHKYSTEWDYDSDGHWQECTVCGYKGEPSAHKPGEVATETHHQRCMVCSYVIQPAKNHTHIFEESWKYGTREHWHECSCGAHSDVAAHTWDEGRVANGIRMFSCTVCGTQKNEQIQEETQLVESSPVETLPDGSTEIAPSAAPDSPETHRPALWIIVLLIAVVVVSGGVTVWWLLRKNKKHNTLCDDGSR